MQILGLHESIRLQIADLRALYAAVEVLAKSGLNPKTQSNFDPQDDSAIEPKLEQIKPT